jgi:hypothetical protein
MEQRSDGCWEVDIQELFAAEKIRELTGSEADKSIDILEYMRRGTTLIQSAAELLSRDFPEPKYAVNGLLSEGVTVFAGKPKTGKSWCALGLAIAVASGGYALGTIQVEQGDALYFALEDGERRLQDRLQKMLGRGTAPSRLHFATQCPRLNEGGIHVIETWIKAHPAARLVVIDTLKRVRPQEFRAGRLYDSDYDAISPLGELGRKHGVSIVVVHHTRKMDGDDPFDLISGSLGLTGAADGAWVLKRARNGADAELHSTGRDFEEQELSLRWDETIFGWKLLGEAEKFRLGKERQEIIDLLTLESPLKPKRVATLLNRGEAATRKLMAAMFSDGQIDNDGNGNYSPKAKTDGNSGNTGLTDRSNTLSGNFGKAGNSGNSQTNAADSSDSYFSVDELGNSEGGLFGGKTEETASVTVVTDDTDVAFEIAERAAILEYDCGYTREEAERLAQFEYAVPMMAAA